MKNCRYCYSEIHERAKICPQCHHQLSMMGSLRAFLITAFPILTAIISLSFAGFEKYEKGLVQSSLTQTEHRLEVSEVQASVAEQAVQDLSSLLPQARMSAIRDVDPNSEVILSPQEQLDEIEKELANIDYKNPINKHRVDKLFNKRIGLMASRPDVGNNQ